MKLFLLSLALAGTLAVPAYAQVPTWKVDVSCKGAIAADKSENFTDIQTVASCMKDESDARAELVKGWTSYSATLRTRCEGEANQGGLPSYVDLLVCLQISSDPGNKPAVAVAPASLKGAGKHRRKAAAR